MRWDHARNLGPLVLFGILIDTGALAAQSALTDCQSNVRAACNVNDHAKIMSDKPITLFLWMRLLPIKRKKRSELIGAMAFCM